MKKFASDLFIPFIAWLLVNKVKKTIFILFFYYFYNYHDHQCKIFHQKRVMQIIKISSIIKIQNLPFFQLKNISRYTFNPEYLVNLPETKRKLRNKDLIEHYYSFLPNEFSKGDHLLAVNSLFPNNDEFEQLGSYITPFNTDWIRMTIAIFGLIFLLSALYFGISSLSKRNKSSSLLSWFSSYHKIHQSRVAQDERHFEYFY